MLRDTIFSLTYNSLVSSTPYIYIKNIYIFTKKHFVSDLPTSLGVNTCQGALLCKADPPPTPAPAGEHIYFAINQGEKPLPQVGQNFSFHHRRHVTTPKPQAMIQFLFYATGRIVLK